MKNNDEKIDFVVLWVDGNDKVWQAQRAKYKSGSDCDNSENRYQNWDNLKYWFRAVENNAPWVNKIHFVTCGQIPDWMDTSCPKLHLVNHSDYMPDDSLPTFNSSAIEVGIHKIPDLNEQFVYFNDDVFLNEPIKPEFYFKNGLPVDMAGFIRTPEYTKNNVFNSLMFNNYNLVYENFGDKNLKTKLFFRWFRPWYGKTFIRSLLCSIKYNKPAFVIPHLSVPYFKKDFELVWYNEGDALRATQHERFRSENDLTHFLIRNWRMCEKRFYPKKSMGKYFRVNDEKSAEKLALSIKKAKYPEICMNEICSGEEFEKVKIIVNTALENRYPKKSMFEK